jgi:hypothetical protein
METNPRKRFLSIRLTEEELKEVYRQCQRSACSSLTEYARKVLTKKPVIVKTRNESQDELLEAMIGIRKRLDQLAGSRDQPAGAPEENTDPHLLREIGEIKDLTRQLFIKWTR